MTFLHCEHSWQFEKIIDTEIQNTVCFRQLKIRTMDETYWIVQSGKRESNEIHHYCTTHHSLSPPLKQHFKIKVK